MKDYIEYKNYACTIIKKNYLLLQTTAEDGTFTKKTVKIESDPEYTFKLMKTKIKARDGAAGLYEFIDRCVRDNFCVVYIDKIFNYINAEMRPTEIIW